MEQFTPRLKKEYAEDVYKQIRTGYIGPFNTTRQFENQIVKFTNSNYAVACSSASTAIMTALHMIENLHDNDEIICSNYSFPAAVNACRFLRLKPVLVDIKYDTLCMDPSILIEKITDKTRAIVFINHNGYMGNDVYKVREICNKHNIFMIEDSACGLGCWSDTGHHAGTIGDVGILSFGVPKLITTAQGGMLITNNEKLANRAREIIDHGSLTWRKDGLHKNTGINFKFNDILSSLGVSQMNNITEILEKRYEIYKWYIKYGIKLHYWNKNTCYGPWFMINMNENAQEIHEKLKKKNIQTKFLYHGIHKSIDENGEYSITDKVYKEALYLPSSLHLEDSDIKYISSIIKGAI